MHQLKVFVSSTCYDLKQIRRDLQDFITTQGHQPVMSEFDSFPIDPSTDTIANCIRNVESADLFVLAIGSRYGYILENGKSITNMEYIYAKKKGIPIFVYIDRTVTSSLGMYKDNPDANFKSIVDDTKVFDFVIDVRTVNQQWCYDFDHAQDIISNLKIRFSHLFSDSLSLRSKLHSDTREELWKVLSPKATAIVLRKALFFELDFFRQVLRDELDKYKVNKYDLEYGIYIGVTTKIDTPDGTTVFLSESFHDSVVIVTSAGKIMNNAFKVFWGEPGTPADLFGVHYVANRLGAIYAEMVSWSTKLSNTWVHPDFEEARNLAARFIIQSASKLWNYPDDIAISLKEILYQHSIGGTGTISSTLVFDTEENLMDQFSAEMARLKNYFRNNSGQWN